MQDQSVYDSRNLAYIVHMDALHIGSMTDHNLGNPDQEYTDTSIDEHLVNTDDALLNTQVVRRRTGQPRKRLSLNLNNLPPPVINLNNKPQTRRANRLSLPQRLMDLELDLSAGEAQQAVLDNQRRPEVTRISRVLPSPSARCPRTRIPVAPPSKGSPKVSKHSGRRRDLAKASDKNNPRSKQSRTKPSEPKPSDSPPTEPRLVNLAACDSKSSPLNVSLETALAAVTLRDKSPQTRADRRRNSDFRLSFEMDI